MSKILNFLLSPFARLSPAQATVLSFLTMSLVGSFLLYFTEQGRLVEAKVPVFQDVKIESLEGLESENYLSEPHFETHVFTKDVQYEGEKFIDMLFTSVSALCVTGLTSTDFSKFTLMGQIITLILIQMGGLGIIVFTSIFAFVIVKGFSEGNSFSDLLAGILDTSNHNVFRMLRHVLFYTLFFELCGFFIMGIHLDGREALLGGMNAWWWALFHSVSAFNNAGFGLLNNNLVEFVHDPVINFTIAALIVLGGLGYPVLIALHTFLRGKLSRPGDLVQKALEKDVQEVVASQVQTKVALIGTVVLISVGMFVPFLMEMNNPILAGKSFGDQLLIHFFQSVSTRTAGFNTIDIGGLGISTLFLYMFLMYVGANPAGTAGGIKIPTLAILYGYVKDWFAEPGKPVILFQQRISRFAVSHAVRLFFFSSLVICFVVFLISFNEAKYLITPDPTFNFTKVLFEVFSAFGTVGLSMGFAGGVTSFSAILTPISKFLIILTMLLGRLGPLTILASLKTNRAKHTTLTEDFKDVQKIQIG